MGPRYVVGIDLGTTNCSVAYAPLAPGGRARPPLPEGLALQQFVAPGQVEERLQLPSCLYLASAHEGFDAPVVGVYARDQGERSPGRLVSSAKSWLCHRGVDRRAALLPWQASDDVTKVSPVEASAAYLEHIRESWAETWRRRGTPCLLEDQMVVLTVPASFDAVARELTVEAAARAGLVNAILLEEPLAAFYAWLACNRLTWRTKLRSRRLVLVCDVGGGTTDFSLVALHRRKKRLEPERVAVGDHILAGGDNFDAALARTVEERLLSRGGSLDTERFSALTASCRRAKERFLGPKPPQTLPIAVVGRGSSLVGQTLTARLTRREAWDLVLDGFFPLCARAEVDAEASPRPGLAELGLAYAHDPAITRNLARFLSRHSPTTCPDAVLFNGGCFVPSALRRRVVAVVEGCYPADTLPPRGIMDLTGEDVEHAVALGAAVYGLARQGEGTRVAGGIGRSYYIGCRGEAAEAVCVVPPTAREGEVFEIREPRFELLVGRPVRFTLYTSTHRHDDNAGEVVLLDEAQLDTLIPLQTVIKARTPTEDTQGVVLVSRLNEVGTLSLFCITEDARDRYVLTFELRTDRQGTGARRAATGPAPSLEPARKRVAAVFEKKPRRGSTSRVRPRRLGKSLENLLATRRTLWPLALCRGLWDCLSNVADGRRRSRQHEEAWFNLSGFCLRPGFGAPLDEWRCERTEALLDAGLQHTKDLGVRLAWWIFWRRVAAGLGQNVHEELYSRLAPHLLPGLGHRRRGPQPEPQERSEMWRLAASLERVDGDSKAALAAVLLETLEAATPQGYEYWALGRIGARVPLSNALHQVLPARTVTPWVEALLRLDWHQAPAGPLALVQLARRTSHRGLDLPDELRQRVLTALHDGGVADERMAPIREVQAPETQETEEVFGESVPEGLARRGS